MRFSCTNVVARRIYQTDALFSLGNVLSIRNILPAVKFSFHLPLHLLRVCVLLLLNPLHDTSIPVRREVHRGQPMTIILEFKLTWCLCFPSLSLYFDYKQNLEDLCWRGRLW